MVLGGERFSILLCASVLHHIPDYLCFIEHACTEHLHRGGTFLSVQDALWYADLSRSNYALTKLGYFACSPRDATSREPRPARAGCVHI